MEKKENDLKLMTTTDIGLAAYLNAKGVRFAGMRMMNGTKNMQFLFIHPDKDMDKLLLDWFNWSGDARILRKYEMEKERLLDLMNNNKKGIILDHGWQKYEPK